MKQARKPVGTDNQVKALKAETKKFAVRIKNEPGLYIRVSPTGVKSFAAVAREPRGKQVWATIGGTELNLDQAIEKGRKAVARIKDGLPAIEPLPTPPDSFSSVAEDYLKRHVSGMISENERRRIFFKYVLPRWKNRPFEEIRRSDVTKLLDEIEDESGPAQANAVLAAVRGLMNWYASRMDDYVSPVVSKMKRGANGSRSRILDDTEIRVIWRAAEGAGTFGAILRLALLTGQRRTKIGQIKWEDVTVDGVWRIPKSDREKGVGGDLPLPNAAIEIIKAQPCESEFVFPGRAARGRRVVDKPFAGFSPCKRTFDNMVAKAWMEAGHNKPMQGWTIHDLRRTARSLLSRAGVRPDIAEHVLGHAIPSVRGVYDRHEYKEEKGAALQRLADLLQSIIDPPAGENVEVLNNGS